jgi:hypothetical protein
MAFSEKVVKQAWDRAGGRCECARITHGRDTRCNQTLVWEHRGKGCEGAWEAHHTTFAGGEEIENCEILCWSCRRIACIC